MPVQNFNVDGMNPYGPKVVFARLSQCPPKCTTYQICIAAEKNDRVTCFGAQQRAGLWRIQTNTMTGRILLLTGGLEIDGKQIEILDRNPFIRGDVEDDEASTQLSINDLPFSFSNDAIDRHLKTMGVKCRTKIKMECDKGPDGVSEYRTGRRTVWINLPPTPLPKKVRIGTFQADLFHWEQKERDLQCRKCYGLGHKSFECENEMVCMVCRLPGHRKGDRACKGKRVEIRESGILKEVDKQTSAVEEKKGETGFLTICTRCDESGHEAGDILCSKWMSSIWEDDIEKDETPVIKTTESKVRTPCKVCGDTSHDERSIECHGSYPSLNSAGSPKRSCTECGQTGHEKGNSFCKGPTFEQLSLDLQQNPTEESATTQLQPTEFIDYGDLVLSNRFEILNTLTPEKSTVQTVKEDKSTSQYQKANSRDEESEPTGKECENTSQDHDEVNSRDREIELSGKEVSESVLAEETIVEEKNIETKNVQRDDKELLEESFKDGEKEDGIFKMFPMFTHDVALASPGSNASNSEIGDKRRVPASSPDGLAVGIAEKGAKRDTKKK